MNISATAGTANTATHTVQRQQLFLGFQDGQLSKSDLALVIGQEAANQFMTDDDTDGDKQISSSEFVNGNIIPV